MRSQGIIETRSLSNDQPREERCLSVGPSDAVKIGMAARNDQVQKRNHLTRHRSVRSHGDSDIYKYSSRKGKGVAGEMADRAKHSLMILVLKRNAEEASGEVECRV